MMSIELYNSVAISNIHGVDKDCIINVISKSEAVNSLKKYWFNQKSGSL